MAEPVTPEEIETAVKGVVARFGTLTTHAGDGAPKVTMAAPLDQKAWRMGSIFLGLPGWNFIPDDSFAAFATPEFGDLAFAGARFEIAHVAKPVARFSGSLTLGQLFDLHPEQAAMLAKIGVPELVFEGTVEPRDSDFPLISMRAKIPKPLVFTPELTLYDASVELACQGSRKDDDGVARVIVHGSLRDPSKGVSRNSALSVATAELQRLGWRLSASAPPRPPGSARTIDPGQSNALEDLLGLLPLSEIEGAKDWLSDGKWLDDSLGAVTGKPSMDRSAIDKVQLDSIVLILAPRGPDRWSVPMVGVTVRADVSLGLAITKPKLTLVEPRVTLELDAPSGVDGALICVGGTLDIGQTADGGKAIGLDMSATFTKPRPWPRLRAALWQPPEEEQGVARNSLANIVHAFGGDAPPALKSLNVEALSLVVDTNGWDLAFDARVGGCLAIPIGNLELRSGAFSFTRTKAEDGAVWSASLKAEISLNTDQGPLLVLGGQYQTDKNLKLSGELKAISKDKPVTLAALVKAFDGDFDAPAILSDISITKLKVDMELGDNALWSFDGGIRWQIPLGGEKADKLTISAKLKISKKPKKKDPAEPVLALKAPDAALPSSPPADKPALKAGADFDVKVEGAIKLARLEFGVSYDYKPKSEAASLFIAFGDQAKARTRFSAEWSKAEKDQKQAQLITLKYQELIHDPATNEDRIEEASINLGALITGMTEQILGAGKGIQLDSSPWNLLNDIQLGSPQLVINLTEKSAAISVAVNADSGGHLRIAGVVVAKLTRISLNYGAKGGKDGLHLSVDGEFMGEVYSEERGNALGWDVLADKPPEMPGTGKAFDLRYLAVGNHVEVNIPAGRQPVSKVVEGLKGDMRPPTPEQRVKAELPVRYSEKTGFVLGADFSVQDTLSITALYQLPDYAGLAVTLAGKRAGAFAGLAFELTYRRIGDVGLYSTSFRVPDKYRKLEFGPVGLTIGAIEVDLYTNSDFRVDLGFPAGGDFARSFSIETPTMIGRGGVYLSKRSGAVAAGALSASNGRFDPVIIAGVGLSIGTVKQVKWGPVSGHVALSLTVILEGVYAPWLLGAPGREIATDDYYFRFVGLAAIAAVVEASVDFKVISAKIRVEALARVLLVMEAYAPTTINAKFLLKANAAVRIGFWTVDKSFEMEAEVDASFGVRQVPPWRDLAALEQAPITGEAHKATPALVEPPKVTLFVTIVPSLNRGGAAYRAQGWPHEERRSSGNEVANIVFSAPLGSQGLELIIRELLDGAVGEFTSSDVEDLQTKLRRLLVRFSGSVGESDRDKLFSLIRARMSFTFREPPANENATTCTLFPVLPGLEAGLEHWIYRPASGGNYDTVFKGVANGGQDLKRQVFIDYYLLLLTTSTQAILTHWQRLVDRSPVPTIAHIVDHLRQVQTSPDTNVLRQISGAVSSMMMGGTRYGDAPLSAALGMQVPLEDAILSPFREILGDTDIHHIGVHIWPHEVDFGFRDLSSGEIIHAQSLGPFLDYRPDHDRRLIDPARTSRLAAQRKAAVSWSLPNRYAWREPELRPIDPVAETTGPPPGQAPHIRLFPHSLLDAIDRLAGYGASLRPAREGDVAPADVRFATIVPLEVSRGLSSEALRMRGANGRDRDRLLALWRDLRDPSSHPVSLALLRQVTLPGEPPRFESEQLDLSGTRVIQANLSTTTVGDRTLSAHDVAVGLQADRASEAGLVSAGLNRPADFVRFSWMASVAGGDFVLRWQTAQGEGWPAGLFGESDTATIWLLAIPRAGPAARTLKDHHNAAVSLEETAVAIPLVVESESPLAPTWDLPTLRPGEFGFTLTRPNPTSSMLGAVGAPDKKQLAESLFNLLSVELAGGFDRAAGFSTPPLTPAAMGDDWVYTVRLSIDDINADPAARDGLARGDLPERASPYRGVIAGETPRFRLNLLDGFGDIWPYPPEELVDLPLRYSDNLLGCDQWPGADIVYRFEAGTAGKARAVVDLRFDTSAFSAPAAMADAADAWRTIGYQLADPNVRVALRTSMGADRRGVRAETEVERQRLSKFAAAAYSYLTISGDLKPATIAMVRENLEGPRNEIRRLNECLPVGLRVPELLALPAAVRFLSAQLERPVNAIFDATWGYVHIPVPTGAKTVAGDEELHSASSSAHNLHLPLRGGVRLTLRIPATLHRRPMTLRSYAALEGLSVLEYLKKHDEVCLHTKGPLNVGGRQINYSGWFASTLRDHLGNRPNPEFEAALADALAGYELNVSRTEKKVETREGETFAELLSRCGFDPFGQGDDYYASRAFHDHQPLPFAEGVAPLLRQRRVPVTDEPLGAFLSRHRVRIIDFAAVNLAFYITRNATFPDLRQPPNAAGEGCDRPRSGETMSAFAQRIGSTVERIAEANADISGAHGLHGVIVPEGMTVDYATAASWKELVWICRTGFGISTTVAELARLNADRPLARPTSLLLPPQPLSLTHDFFPATANAIEEIGCELVFRRPEAKVEPEYPGARKSASAIRPAIRVDEAESSLDAFADALERAMPGRKVAVGYRGDGRTRLFAVDLKRFGLGGDGPKFDAPVRYALPPLDLGPLPVEARRRTIRPGTGLLDGASWRSPAESNDLRVGLGHMFDTVERILAPDLASQAYYYAPDRLSKIILAKWTFAAKLAGDLRCTHGAADQGARDAAAQRFRQALNHDLRAARTLDGIHQFPVRLDTAWGPAFPPLTCLPSHPLLMPDAAKLGLRDLEARLGVSGQALAHALADLYGILAIGKPATYRGRTVIIEPRHTLRTLLADIGAPPPEEVDGTNLRDIPDLFRSGAAIPIEVHRHPTTPQTSLKDLQSSVGIPFHEIVANIRNLKGIFGEPPEENIIRGWAAAVALARSFGWPISDKINVPSLAKVTSSDEPGPEARDLERRIRRFLGVRGDAEVRAVRVGEQTFAFPKESIAGRTLAIWHRANPGFSSIQALARALETLPLQLGDGINFVRRRGVGLDEMSAAAGGIDKLILLHLLADRPGILFRDGQVHRDGGNWTSPPGIRLTRQTTLRQAALRLAFDDYADFARALSGATDGVLRLEGSLFEAGVAIRLSRATLAVHATPGAPRRIADIADAMGISAELVLMQLPVDDRKRLVEDPRLGLVATRPINCMIHVSRVEPPRLVGALLVRSPSTGESRVLGSVKLAAVSGRSTVECPVAAAAMADLPPDAQARMVFDQIEYDIADVDDSGGYQASHWLRVLRPVAVPVAMPERAPPNIPFHPATSLWQTASATEAGPPARWTADASFTVTPLDREIYHFCVATNADAQPRTLSVVDALADWSALRGDIDSFLAGLLGPPALDSRNTDFLMTTADLVENVANGWNELRGLAVEAPVGARLELDAASEGGGVRSIAGGRFSWAPPAGLSARCDLSVRDAADQPWRIVAQYDAAGEGRVDLNWPVAASHEVRLRVLGLDLFSNPEATVAVSAWRPAPDAGADRALSPVSGPVTFPVPAQPSLVTAALALDRASSELAQQLAGAILTTLDVKASATLPEMDLFIDEFAPTGAENGLTMRRALHHIHMPAGIGRETLASQLSSQVNFATLPRNRTRLTIKVWSPWRAKDAPPVAEYRDVPLH